MRKYILFFMLLAFSMGAAAQPQITRKPKPKQEQAKPNNSQRNNKPAAQPSQKPKPKVTFSNNTIMINGVACYSMVFVEGGTFQMGSNDGESWEKPVHQVTLSSYYIGKTEVTQELWQAVMGRNPSWSRFKSAKNPANNVSWNDCQEFIRKLNSLTGESFRLPTEAEWEFAARGGNNSRGYQYSGSDNLGSVAWSPSNANNKVHPVGSKHPNELGLYDMSGNVYEWCADWFGPYPSSSQTNPNGASIGEARVLRGGTWDVYLEDAYCRIAFRMGGQSDYGDGYCGLRLAQ